VGASWFTYVKVIAGCAGLDKEKGGKLRIKKEELGKGDTNFTNGDER
jgi:hypothetical protein